MIWRFGKKQLSDVVKIQQFLEKEGIDYELLLDNIDVQVGDSAPQTAPTPPIVPPPPSPKYDWQPAEHDGKMCMDKTCDNPFH